MRVLYATRLFSGLETSAHSGKWTPTGVPTIHRMVMALDQRAHLNIILTCKDGNSTWSKPGRTDLKLEGLSAPVAVLGGTAQWSSFVGRMRGPARELWHASVILSEAKRLAPDLIYVDHANTISGALVARYTRIPVVFRIMGVYPEMRATLRALGLTSRAMTWAYRSKFALALCTEDGSGVKPWLDKALNPGVETHVLLNGVDPTPQSVGDVELPFEWPQGKTTVLFVGKLERTKGCLEFMEAFKAASEETSRELHAVIIGSGTLEHELRDRIAYAGLSSEVTLLTRVAHRHILEIQRRSDIYVSLNRLGNLSNANLEAFRMGSTVILPRSLPDLGPGDPTLELLPLGAMETIKEPDDIAGLAQKLLFLHRSPRRRIELGARLKEVAESIIPTWEQRIDHEFELLKRVASSFGAR